MENLKLIIEWLWDVLNIKMDIFGFDISLWNIMAFGVLFGLFCKFIGNAING